MLWVPISMCKAKCHVHYGYLFLGQNERCTCTAVGPRVTLVRPAAIVCIVECGMHKTTHIVAEVESKALADRVASCLVYYCCFINYSDISGCRQ